MTFSRLALAALLACTPGLALAQAQPPAQAATQTQAPPQRLHATIDSVSPTAVQVTTQGGAHMTVELSNATRIGAMRAAKLSDITPDSYVGSAAMTQADGRMVAMEVHIFPPAMRGIGDGFHPWDAGPQSSMTNGAVGTVTGTDGRTIVIAYKGGEKTIFVPPDAPVVRLSPGSPALLTKGAHVTVSGTMTAEGTMAARSITVGVNGLVPPL
jgi:hypothetical protein